MCAFKSTIKETIELNKKLSIFENMKVKELNWNSIKHTEHDGDVQQPTKRLNLGRGHGASPTTQVAKNKCK